MRAARALPSRNSSRRIGVVEHRFQRPLLPFSGHGVGGDDHGDERRDPEHVEQDVLIGKRTRGPAAQPRDHHEWLDR